MVKRIEYCIAEIAFAQCFFDRFVTEHVNRTSGTQLRKSFDTDPVGLAFVDKSRPVLFERIGNRGRLPVVKSIGRIPGNKVLKMSHARCAKPDNF